MFIFDIKNILKNISVFIYEIKGKFATNIKEGQQRNNLKSTVRLKQNHIVKGQASDPRIMPECHCMVSKLKVEVYWRDHKHLHVKNMKFKKSF